MFITISLPTNILVDLCVALICPYLWSTSGIRNILLVHSAVPKAQEQGQDCHYKAGSSTSEVTGGIPSVHFTGFPYPLRNDLANTSCRVVQSNGNRHRSYARGIASNPGAERSDTWKCASRCEHEAAISSRICMARKTTRNKPSDTTQDRAKYGVVSSGI